MRLCALCDRSTTPKNGAHDTSDAVLCHFCLTTYEASPEYKREQHYRKAKHDSAARAALSDFIGTTLKIRQVEHEKSRNEQAAKELAEKKAKEEAEKKAAEAQKPAQNGATGAQAPAKA